MTLLIDAGHGADGQTLCKFSPEVAGLGIENDPTVYNGRFREGNFNRLIAAGVQKQLQAEGYNVILITPEANDISITERVRRVNYHCNKYGAQNCVLLSIHANAAGSNADVWSNARGWLSIVDDKASSKAKAFADMLYDTVKKYGFTTRRPTNDRKYYFYRECIGKPSRLPILSKTSCPAVLTENFFYTNKEDLLMLATPEGRARIVAFTVKAIKDYVKKYS